MAIFSLLMTLLITMLCDMLGVGYAEWFPWQLGAAAVTTTLVGFGYKYSKEALTWQEE